MKRYIMILASVLMALTTFAQKELMVLVVESESYTTKVNFVNRAEVSFWGQPQGEEQNGDLTITMSELKGESASFTMKATDWKNFDKGFYISEQEGLEEWDDVIHMGAEATYTEGCHCYSLSDVEFDENNKYAVTIAGLKPNTTYYIKPYAIVATDTVFGSEKTFTTQWTIDALVAQDMFGSWYVNAKIKDAQGVFIVPTAEAWKALCNKYPEIFGEEPSEIVQQVLTTEWFCHLTPAEADMMKAHSVAYYDNCEEGEVYVVDRVCDEMIPNLLKAKANIDLTRPNLDVDKYGDAIYTTNCNVETVWCDASYGIEGNRYVKTEPSSRLVRVGYNLPFMLLPNCIYNVSVTIAPNTEDVEDERPNKFQIYVYQDGDTKGKTIANPQTTTEETPDYTFIYGGQKLETFTFQIDTHDEEYVSDIIQFRSYITAVEWRMVKYSEILRIAKITISSVIDNIVVDDVEIDGIYYKIDSETQTAQVVNGGYKYTGEIIIPTSIEDDDVIYTVTSIGDYAFANCSGLTSVTIPKSVTSISIGAFEGCSGLMNVYCYAKSIQEVKSSAFDINIEDATLHVPAVSIEAYKAAEPWKNFGKIVPFPIDGIYYNLDDDTQTAEVTYGDIKYRDEVFIPKSVMYGGTTYSVTSIGDYAFQNCGGLTSVTIPNSVASIGDCAFQYCPGLTSVTIPEGVTIGHLAFMYCMGLTSVTLPDNLKEMSPDAFWYSNLKFPLYNSTTFFFLDGTYSGEIVIPDGIEKIAEHAFNNCRGLTSVTIPESVTSIGTNAFAGCSGLTDFYCYADNVPETDAPFERWWWDLEHTYTYTESEVDLENITLHVPAASIEAYKAVEPWKNFGKIVALPDVEIVPMEEDVEIAFDGNILEETDLTSVVIENVYVTLNTKGDDGYDTEEKCIVLISTVTDEQLEAIADKEVGDNTVKENYNGLIIEVPAGSGIISITTQTKGACTLNVKIGDAEAQTFVQPERGVVEIPYTVDKDTYVYIYGASTASAKRRVASSDTENGVLIYGIKWEGETTDIDPVVAADGGTYQIYTVDGTLVNTLQKGVNIIRYSDGQTKKVFIK